MEPEIAPERQTPRVDEISVALERITDFFISLDAQWQFIALNHRAEQYLGKSKEQILGSTIWDVFPQLVGTALYEQLNSAMAEQAPLYLEMVSALFAGRWFDAYVYPSSSGLDIFAHETTARKRAEDQLREQSDLLDHAQDAIFVHDLEGRILFWNKSAERIYGWTKGEAVGKDVLRVLYKSNPSRLQQVFSVLLEKGEWIGELHRSTKDGSETVVESRSTLVRGEGEQPRSVLVIDTDITERKKIEYQFLRAQRVESIGILASGIAHDINNILSPILMAIRMLRLGLQDDDRLRLLELLQRNAERGGQLARQVLEFIRGVEGEPITLQSSHLIREAVRILSETLPKSIMIEGSIPEDLWPVTGDPTQLHQVLMNLCVNASDAMPEGGRLSIDAETIEIDESYSRMSLDARPARFVCIKVKDTGTGIPADVIDRIFEPFFTTKEIGKGTGLGLSTVSAIVKSHGGFLEVCSEIGKGSEFKVYIPAAESLLTQQAEDINVEPAKGHGEMILVADDETAIREVIESLLEAHGYRALVASDGTEAVALFAQYKEEVKVALVDMMMPYMDGRSTIRALKRLDPQVKIIASSGLKTKEAVDASGVCVERFLAKPYTAEKLLSQLSEILSQ